MHDRYGTDVLASGGASSPPHRARPVVAELDLVVEDVDTGWCGAVIGVETVGGMQVVHLEDRRGRIRGFPLGPGFLIDGAPVLLTAPGRGTAAPARPARTASGSTAVADVPARVAAASRIFVEGRHDAELVEKVWGADLRLEGVVVEMLDGVDDLRAAIRDFAPAPDRRMGVLIDHLVPGSKETRLVAEARRERAATWVRIVGHPYVDVWQAVRPHRLGLSAWPVIAPGRSWKHAVLEELGWPCQTQEHVAVGWRRILATVRSYHDVEPPLLASVEELIDFVTVPHTESSAS